MALVTDAFGGYGGIAQYNRDLLTALAAQDRVSDVLVLPRLADQDLEPLPQKIQQLAPTRTPLIYAAQAAKAALRFRPDIIFNGHLYHGPLAAALVKLTGAKLVSQLHGTEVWRRLSRRHLMPLQLSNVVLCVSRDTCTKYSRQSASENAVVVHNTVGSDFTPGNRAAARARFQLDDRFVILTVARLDARNGYKGHDKVIAALPRVVAETGRRVTYLIAGIGEDQPRLEQLAREAGLANVVRFLGKVSRAELPDLYRAADLFAMPSTGEGFGIVFLEAMACGTPAIGLAFGGSPDALADGALGACVPPEADFSAALAAAVAAPRPDPVELASKVQARFGLAAFEQRVGDVLTHLEVA